MTILRSGLRRGLRPRLRTGVLLLLPVFLLLAGLAGAPPAAAQQMTTPEEARLGAEQNPQVLAEFGGAYKDAKLQAFIDEIGRRLVAVTPMKGEKFAFQIVDSDVVNAFALPGGYVYVSRGLLALAESEAEVAGVLGHEIGHVVAHHPTKRLQQQQYAGLGGAAAQVLGGLLGGYFGGEAGAQIGSQLGGSAGQFGATYYVQGYSRDQEFEADQYGVRFLEAAGYEPRAMASFLQALAGYDTLQAKVSGSANTTPSWLMSHPRTPDRVARAAAAAAEQSPGSRDIDRPALLAATDGMIFGDDPSQGVVKGTRFVHPKLRFAFDAPDGFTLKNNPDAVVGRDRGGRLLQFDTATSRGDDPADYLEREWARNGSVDRVDSFSVNGLPAATGIAQVKINGQASDAMLAAIRGGGGQIYRFIFADARGLTRDDLGLFDDCLRTFRTLSAGEAAAIRPMTVKVVTVRPGDSRESLAGRMEVDKYPREWFDLINGFTRGRGDLEAGEQVKLIVQ